MSPRFHARRPARPIHPRCEGIATPGGPRPLPRTGDLMTPTTNRRRHARYATAIECKLIRGAHSRYDTARTGDISAGGAMLEVFTARPIREGETIDIAVNWGIAR